VLSVDQLVPPPVVTPLNPSAGRIVLNRSTEAARSIAVVLYVGVYLVLNRH
jgi:hypothetical protein